MTKKYPNFCEKLINFTQMLESFNRVYEKPIFNDALDDKWKGFEDAVKRGLNIVLAAALEQLLKEVVIPADEFMSIETRKAEEEMEKAMTRGETGAACYKVKPVKFLN